MSLNTPENIYLIYAFSHIGAVANLIIAASTREEIVRRVRTTNSKAILSLIRYSRNLKRKQL